jgi:hypothetical protein
MAAVPLVYRDHHDGVVQLPASCDSVCLTVGAGFDMS